jgi:beta-hydroxylase
MDENLCKIEHPYKKKKNNFTFNKNDKVGLLNFFFIMTFMILIILYIKQNNNKNFLYIAIISLFIFIVSIYYKPIGLLYMISGLLTLGIRTPEFLDKDKYFPNNYLFEKPENFKILKKEVVDILSKTDNGDTLKMTADTFSNENKYIGSHKINDNGKIKAWRVINIKVGNEYTKVAYENFPFLVKLLESMPEVCSCAISVLQEGVHIPIHNGYYKGIMRYMIPIIVPKDRDNVFLCVNEIKYNWTEGVGVLWDDNYPHKVYNNTKEIRVVIYMDVIRPFSGLLNDFNKFIVSLTTNSKIVKDEIRKTEIQIKNKE